MKPSHLTRLLTAAFCLLIAVLALVGWRGISHLSLLNTQMQTLVGDEWKELGMSHEAYSLSDQNSRITLLIFLTDDQDEIKRLLAERAATTERISALMQALAPRLDPDEKQLFDAVEATRTPYVESYQQALWLLVNEHKPAEARKMMVDVVLPKLMAYHDAWNAFDQNEGKAIDHVLQESKAEYVTGQREFFLTLVLAELIAVTIAVFTVTRLGREMAVRYHAEQLSQKAHALLRAEMIEHARTTGELERIFALSPDAIYTKGFDGYLKHFNPALEHILGYSKEELLAEPFINFAHPDDQAAVTDAMNHTIEDGKISGFESRYRCKDGSYKWIEWNAVAVSKEQLFTGTGRDITARKHIEARLFQSQKMETVGKLAGGVAHEFNSILTAIIGQSEFLLNDLPPDNPLGKSAREIRQAADRAATLTRQLLAYGRKQILQPEILDLNRVVSDMASTLQHLMSSEVTVRIITSPGLKNVKIDPGQMEQVIVSLTMNAADAMPNGGQLTLETSNVTLDEEYVRPFPGLKPGGYVMLAITDTGIGMSDEVKARAFEPFFSTKGVGQGTGLGLSTCYGILKQSEGHINVYSEVARGTTFKIYLPQVGKQTTSTLPRLKSPDLPRGTETILLAEDDPSLLEMSATLLRRLGYTVITAVNGVEALNLKNKKDIGHIDLLFTDVVMPHMSGKELSDRIRAIYPHTKILFTSAYTESAIVHQGVLNEGVMLLQKPFTPSALAYKVREVLD